MADSLIHSSWPVRMREGTHCILAAHISGPSSFRLPPTLSRQQICHLQRILQTQVAHLLCSSRGCSGILTTKSTMTRCAYPDSLLLCTHA